MHQVFSGSFLYVAQTLSSTVCMQPTVLCTLPVAWIPGRVIMTECELGACAGCDNMTCCIVVVNRDAPTASLPPFSGGGIAQGQEHSGNAPAQPQQQAPAPDQDAPQPMHPGPVPPGLEQPSAAASARAH